ncbi:porin [Comamonas composti]|uniref:porin n=1 Tax=Comamonas composti TaxID=408558 RepID=UPI00041041C9|nr:porin [Comamonas composti]
MMKMNRVAVAVLAVLGATTVMAQSSVTIYGRLNTTVERQKTGDVNRTSMENNSSRWGIRGVEDLGSGLKAGFVLESGFNSDTGMGSAWTHGTGAGMSFARQSEVNLSSNFGMLRLGNFIPESYFASADAVSMHNHDTGSSADALYQDPIWFGGLSTQNKIGYRTPNMGGLVINASVSMHEKTPTTYQKNGYDLAATYDMGPLSLGAGYSAVGDDWQASLRGLYTFGQFTLGGYYQRSHQVSQRLGWMDGNRNNYRLSGMYTLGASEFHANVGYADKWSNVSDSSAKQWTLGYNYNLSKRTKVYGYYTKVDNKAGSAYMTGKAGDDFSSFAVGVRHNF